MIPNGSNTSLDGKMMEDTSKMVSFKEIGEYLDKLEIEKKFDLMAKIVEDLTYPKINVSPPDDLQWSKCSPVVSYECIQLTKENLNSLRFYLNCEFGFL